MDKHPGDMMAKPGQSQEDRQLRMVGSMEEMRKENWVPFTLGPLYLAGQLDFDVIARYCTEAKRDVLVSHIDFNDFKLFDMPETLGHRMLAMNDEAYPDFVEFMLSVEVIDRANKRYFQVARFGAPIIDPFMRFLNVTVPKPETIDVWTAIGLGGMIVPKTHVEYLPYPIFKPGEAEDLSRQDFLSRLPRPITAPMLVEFEWKKTRPEIVQRGLRLLGELE